MKKHIGVLSMYGIGGICGLLIAQSWLVNETNWQIAKGHAAVSGVMIIIFMVIFIICGID